MHLKPQAKNRPRSSILIQDGNEESNDTPRVTDRINEQFLSARMTVNNESNNIQVQAVLKKKSIAFDSGDEIDEIVMLENTNDDVKEDPLIIRKDTSRKKELLKRKSIEQIMINDNGANGVAQMAFRSKSEKKS